MSEINVNVLVAARDEYTNQLSTCLTSQIYNGLQSIYHDSCKNNENKENCVLRQFQILLKKIPQWNSTILHDETQRIKKEIPLLMDLVTAVFVSNVRILASVRLKGDSKKIQVRIPTSNIFIHRIYTNCAEKFYYSPHLLSEFVDYRERQTNKIECYNHIDSTIRIVISDMLPIDSILKEYLANVFNSNSNNVADEADDEDNDDFDDETESTVTEKEKTIDADKILNEISKPYTRVDNNFNQSGNPIDIGKPVLPPPEVCDRSSYYSEDSETDSDTDTFNEVKTIKSEENSNFGDIPKTQNNNTDPINNINFENNPKPSLEYGNSNTNNIFPQQKPQEQQTTPEKPKNEWSFFDDN